MRAIAFVLLATLVAAPRAHATMSTAGILQHSPDDITGFNVLTGDSAVVNATLPFTFTVEGVGYTFVALSTNGWLEFGGNSAADSDPTNDCLPTAAHTRPFLAPYWDDMNTWGTNIRYGTVGSAPNRVFIADYEMDLTAGNEGSDDLRFQVQLHEGSNLITVRYRETQSNANGQAATIGFQGAGGAAATTVQPISCNVKTLDDNRPNEGWSADVGRAGLVTMAGILNFSPDDISGFTTLTGDNAVNNVSLPFDVTLGGANYNSLAISTNGWIEFGGNTGGDSDPSNDCLPTNAHTNPFLAAYWDDLNPWGTAIRYATVGTAPNRMFVADYQLDNSIGEGSDDLFMQVRIHERSSLITVRYRDKQVNANGQTATIGFQGAGGSAGASHPLTCNGKILDDNDPAHEGFSVHPKANGAYSLHAITAFSPDDIDGTTIPGLQTLSGDNATQNVTLPFTITLDGVSYSTLTVSTNGWIEIGGNSAADSDPTNDCLPTSVHTRPFIAAFWDDMRTAGSSAIEFGTVGQSPNRTFIADFFLDTVTSGDDGNDDARVQVQIHEGSNVISVKYPPSELLANGQTATIGYQSAGGSAATAYPIGCNARVLDDNVADTGWSVAPLPVCGNGISEPRGGEQCDGGASNGSATSCCTSTCQFRGAGETCRAGAGAPCDVSETCTGASGVCPLDDASGNAGITCRLGSGDACDPDELCTGVAGQGCPTDVRLSAGTQCRAGSGDQCDLAEACTGVAGEPCPPNTFAPSSVVCRPGSGDGCDAIETCPGLPGAQCPSDDAPLKAGMICRGGSGDQCDQNEACTGVPGATCPPDDAPGNTSIVCRPSSVAGAFCDEPESCSGVPGATCPPNDAPAKINVICRPGSGDLCDPAERCSGVAGQGCPPNVVANPTVVCRAGSGDACDPDERCTAIPGAPCPADTVEPEGTVCRASSGTCDVAETCGGTAGQACPADTGVVAGNPCDLDGNLCTEDVCDGSGACTAGGTLDCEDGNLCTQDSCDPLAGCVSTGTPATTCRPATKASLLIKDNAVDAADLLKFGWKGGPALLADLGDPRATTRYELCIYDDGGVRMALGVPAGSGWQAIGPVTAPKGWKFKSSSSQFSGVRSMSLKASSLPKAQLKLGARGAEIPGPTVPFTLPVTAQLHAGDGTCFEATFAVGDSRRNDVKGFTGKK